MLKVLGWKIVGQQPELNKCVYIFAPHTSNWDFPLMLLFRSATQLKPNFIGKHTLFWPPLSWIMRSLGGEPVDRGKAKDVVDQIVEKFQTKDVYRFALAPEGTRSKKSYWKTGFYRVAYKAKVPIQLIYLDKKTKEVGFGPLLEPSGDIEKDFEWLRSFYQSKQGIRPELLSDIRINVDHQRKDS